MPGNAGSDRSSVVALLSQPRHLQHPAHHPLSMRVALTILLRNYSATPLAPPVAASEKEGIVK